MHGDVCNTVQEAMGIHEEAQGLATQYATYARAQELQSLSPGSWLLSSYPLHLSIISVIRNLSQKASFFYKALSNTNSHHLHLQRHDQNISVPRFCGAGLGPACASHRQLREQVDDVHQQWVGGQAC